MFFRKIKGFSTWRELGEWRPDYDEIKNLSAAIYKLYGTTTAAEKAKDAGDNWNAHNVFTISHAPR